MDLRLVGYAAGIAQYGVQLSRALVALGGPESYVLLRGRRDASPRSDHDRVRERRCLTPPHHRFERWSLPVEIVARAPRPHLVHSIDHVAPAWGPWRSVVTLHDLAFLLYPEAHTAASRTYYAAAGESARRAHRVIAVSQRTASDATRLLGVDPARLRVVHEAAGAAYLPRPRADLDAVAARHRFEPNRSYVLLVGTLEPRKNIPLAIDAFSRARQHVDAQLLIVGARGWLDGPIFQAHARSGVRGDVHFLGLVPEVDLAVLYSHASVFAFPSLYEGFGLPLVEAMACGAPIVCSDAGPMPEVLGGAGLLLPPRDVDRWASSLARVLGDDRLAGELRERGFRRSAQFSWERAARATRDVYREALLA